MIKATYKTKYFIWLAVSEGSNLWWQNEGTAESSCLDLYSHKKERWGAGNDICLLKTQNPLPETPPSTRSLLPTPTFQSSPNSFPTGHSLFEYMNLWKTFSFMPPQRGSYSFAHMRVSPAVTAMMILRDQRWSTCFTLTNLVMQSFLILEYFLLSWQHFKILRKKELLST